MSAVYLQAGVAACGLALAAGVFGAAMARVWWADDLHHAQQLQSRWDASRASLEVAIDHQRGAIEAQQRTIDVQRRTIEQLLGEQLLGEQLLGRSSP